MHLIDLTSCSMSLNELAVSILGAVGRYGGTSTVKCLPNEKKMRAVLKIIERTHCFVEFKEVPNGYEFWWNPDKKVEGWLPMESAPQDATWIMVKMKDGSELKAHWAQDLSGEYSPPFKGWFKRSGDINVEIQTPIKWKPIIKNNITNE